jgi:hypothetical protein
MQYPNLQRSLLFKVLPKSAQQQILSQRDIASACYELQLQLELHPSIAAELKRRHKAGEGIDAMKELGLQGRCPGDVTDEQWQQLIDIDPASYHPSSTKLTPTARTGWDVFFSEHLGPNWRDEL